MAMRKIGLRRMQRCPGMYRFLGFVFGLLLGMLVTSCVRTLLLSGNFVPPFSCSTRSRSFSSLNLESPPDVIDKDDATNGRSLILVGVMTAQKYLDTRALAVYQTWAKTLPGRLIFFSSATSETDVDIPLVRLHGVDDSYPPQKKSFLMLKYMHDHFLEEFEWFMRADDDVYVRGDKLELFLRSINSSKPYYIGQAGMGNKEEFGQLSLEDDENFCMGGPGMILSRETLKLVAPHVRYCLKNLYSTHEDVEIGRCIRRFAGIPCTWSYEMQSIFYHNSSGNDAFAHNLKTREVHRSITLHPVKQYQHLYRVHNYMQSLRIQELQQRMLLLSRDIRAATLALNESVEYFDDVYGNSEDLGKGPGLNKFIPKNSSDIVKWDFFSRVIFSDGNLNPKRRIEEPLKNALGDVVTQVMEMINKFSQQRGRVIDFKEILYGYKRVVPMYGADYILDLLLVYKKYRGKKMTIPVRRHAYLQQAFTPLQIREVVDGLQRLNSPTDLISLVEQGLNHLTGTSFSSSAHHESVKDKTVHFILPLAGRFPTFERFMVNYEDVCLKNDDNVKLAVILFKLEDSSHFYKSIGLLKSLELKYPHSSISYVEAKGQFSRALAMELGAGQFGPEALLYFVDVDMMFNAAFLERVRLNTIAGLQVYFPIVYSQFDPEVLYGENSEANKDEFLINADNGYWRQYGFGIAAMYKSDLTAVGGFDTSIQGWGREDVDLFDKVVQSNLTIFRAADPGLIHIFHIIDCDANLIPEQYKMCIGTRANSFGSLHKLAEIVHLELLSKDGTLS